MDVKAERRMVFRKNVSRILAGPHVGSTVRIGGQIDSLLRSAQLARLPEARKGGKKRCRKSFLIIAQEGVRHPQRLMHSGRDGAEHDYPAFFISPASNSLMSD